MTKEPDKCIWYENYKNKSLSGIEFRDRSGELVHFIAIKHDEVLEKGCPHRVAIKTDEGGKKKVVSMKELRKQSPLLNSIDPKEVKLLLKSAPPGASVVLPNGTVVKKSRRGGARVGAGRKRSRPLPHSQGLSNSHQAKDQPTTSTANNPSSLQPQILALN